ncbi:MAG: AcrR family transcriptional regulator [Alcanivorax sp.]|jgi:AcrR family transcriptional regulator
MSIKPVAKNTVATRRTQAERTALSDQRMLEVAIKLINERGTHKTTLKEIGELAGYSRGLANYRFGSKDGLIRELFTKFDERWKNHIESYIEQKSGIAAVLAAADALRDFLNVESQYMRAMYTLWYESLGKESEIRNSLAGHHDIYRKDATRWIEAGIASGEIDPKIDPTQFAVQYCAFILGLIYQWLVNAKALDLDAIFDEYEANIIKLLSKKGVR